MQDAHHVIDCSVKLNLLYVQTGQQRLQLRGGEQIDV